MNKRKVAIIAFHFCESTLPLAKHLSGLNCQVDYYYIVNWKANKEFPGLSMTQFKFKLGVNKIDTKEIPYLANYLNGSGISFNIIQLPPLIRKSNFINTVFFKYLKFKLKHKDYDYVNLVGHDNLMTNFYYLFKENQLSHTIHEIGDHSNPKGILFEWLKITIEKGIKVIVHSKSIYNQLLAANFDNNKLYYVPFGLFETFSCFNKSDLDLPKDGILFIGNFLPYKGLDVLYEAIQILNSQKRNYKFIVAGSGNSPDANKIEKLNGCYVVNRKLSNAEFAGLVSSCKLVVCPYKSASQSGIVMSAFMYAKPIIASDVGAFSEVIRNNYNGLLVEPNSPEMLASAIDYLCINQLEYKAMVTNIREFSVSSEYSWTKIAQRTKDILEK